GAPADRCIRDRWRRAVGAAFECTRQRTPAEAGAYRGKRQRSCPLRTGVGPAREPEIVRTAADRAAAQLAVECPLEGLAGCAAGLGTGCIAAPGDGCRRARRTRTDG